MLVAMLAAVVAPPLLGERVGGDLAFSGMAVVAAALLLRRGLFAPLDLVEGFLALLAPAAALAALAPWAALWLRPPPPDACAAPLGLLGTVAPPYVAALAAVAAWVAAMLRLWWETAFARFDPRRAPPLRAKQAAALGAGLALLFVGALAAMLNAACEPGFPTIGLLLPFLTALSTGFAALYVIVALAGRLA